MRINSIGTNRLCGFPIIGMLLASFASGVLAAGAQAYLALPRLRLCGRSLGLRRRRTAPARTVPSSRLRDPRAAHAEPIILVASATQPHVSHNGIRHDPPLSHTGSGTRARYGLCSSRRFGRPDACGDVCGAKRRANA